MCATCGCDGDVHEHEHDHEHGKVVKLEADLLAKNDHLAGHNRAWLREHHVVALNFVSSPGSGKTTLLERTIRDVGKELGLGVIEGDQATTRDADRIRAAGARAVQVNTGTGCHLDAHMVAHALQKLEPERGSMVVIENVGNLVCPALFDLGERAKVAVVSVTEGDDKPLKYPHMFRASSLMLVNKIDLLPYVSFDVAACVANAREVNPSLRVMEISATRGDGLDAFYGWLREVRT
jgi:hydrogenase nickel incorporation protein HypB